MALFSSCIVILSCTLLIRLSVLSPYIKIGFSPQRAFEGYLYLSLSCTLHRSARNLERSLRERERDISVQKYCFIVHIYLKCSNCMLKSAILANYQYCWKFAFLCNVCLWVGFSEHLSTSFSTWRGEWMYTWECIFKAEAFIYSFPCSL